MTQCVCDLVLVMLCTLNWIMIHSMELEFNTTSTGYNINGSDTRSCLLNHLNASWSLPTPSCSLVNCGNPGELVNGYTNDSVVSSVILGTSTKLQAVLCS